MIVSVATYRDDQNRVIEAHTPYTGEFSLGNATLYAPLTVPVRSPQGMIPVEVRVPLDTADIVDAFDRFKELVEKNIQTAVRAEIQRMEKAANENRLRQQLSNPG